MIASEVSTNMGLNLSNTNRELMHRNVRRAETNRTFSETEVETGYVTHPKWQLGFPIVHLIGGRIDSGRIPQRSATGGFVWRNREYRLEDESGIGC